MLGIGEQNPRGTNIHPRASGGTTELLLGVLDGVGSYDARVLEAERDGDHELADFLRELRRQDAVRVRWATRLLRRPPAIVQGREEERGEKEVIA